MAGAEIGVEKAASQQVEDVRDHNLVSGPGKGISAGLAAGALQEPSRAQHPQEFRGMVLTDSLRMAHLGYGETAARPLSGDLEQAAQTVFFRGSEFHIKPS
jgi:hypothetical protein